MEVFDLQQLALAALTSEHKQLADFLETEGHTNPQVVMTISWRVLVLEKEIEALKKDIVNRKDLGKWTFSNDEEHWNNASFATEQEAIAAGRAEYQHPEADDIVDTFYVGWIKRPDVRFNALTILDDIAENFGDQCGEYADDWYRGVKEEEGELFEAELQQTVDKWMRETSNYPTFYTIGAYTSYPVEQV